VACPKVPEGHIGAFEDGVGGDHEALLVVGLDPGPQEDVTRGPVRRYRHDVGRRVGAVLGGRALVDPYRLIVRRLGVRGGAGAHYGLLGGEYREPAVDADLLQLVCVLQLEGGDVHLEPPAVAVAGDRRAGGRRRRALEHGLGRHLEGDLDRVVLALDEFGQLDLYLPVRWVVARLDVAVLRGDDDLCHVRPGLVGYGQFVSGAGYLYGVVDEVA